MLSLFNVEDCSLGPRHGQAARNHGWSYRIGKHFNGVPVKGGATGPEWDSIVHASFQLGGAFSERTLTAAGVEGIDAIPVLHMAVGATQPDALVDTTRDGSLRSFFRPPNEKHLNQTIAPSIKMSRHKPTLRASKQQNMADVLTGFGG